MEYPEKYDPCNRLLYNPSYHDKQGTAWTLSDMEYLCKYLEIDGIKSIAMGLGRTETTTAAKATSLRKSGLFEVYKGMNKYW